MSRTRSRRVKTPNGAGSVYRGRDGRWHARYTTIDPESGLAVRRSLYGATEQEVRAKLIRALGEQHRGTLPFTRGRGLTLKQFVDRWLHTGRGRPKTQHRYRELQENHVVPTLGHLQLINLEPQHVNGLLRAKHQGGLSARTCNHVRAVLRTCLNDAMRENLVGRNVAELARPLGLDDAQSGRVLTAEQVQILLQAAARPRGVAAGSSPLACARRAS